MNTASAAKTGTGTDSHSHAESARAERRARLAETSHCAPCGIDLSGLAEKLQKTGPETSPEPAGGRHAQPQEATDDVQGALGDSISKAIEAQFLSALEGRLSKDVAPEPAYYAYGCKVELHGLVSQSNLNGRVARTVAQPRSVLDRGRLRVVLCAPDGAPAFHGGVSDSCPECGLGQGKRAEFQPCVCKFFLSVKPANIRALAQADPKLEQEVQRMEEAPLTLEQLDQQLITKIMAKLSLPERVTLAASHPILRQVLFDPENAERMWGEQPLVLALCNHSRPGGSWHKAASCICCGASFLEKEIRACELCRNVWFCADCGKRPRMRTACWVSESMGLKQSRRGYYPAVSFCVEFKGTAAPIIPGSSTEAERLYHNTAGSLPVLTDRWLCSLPQRLRASVAGATRQLVLRSANGDHGNSTRSKWCGSLEVGLGALLCTTQQGPAWPKLLSLTFGESDNRAVFNGSPGNRPAEALYDFVFDRQLRRLASSMPKLRVLACGGERGYHSDSGTIESEVDMVDTLLDFPTVDSIQCSSSMMHKLRGKESGAVRDRIRRLMITEAVNSTHAYIPWRDVYSSWPDFARDYPNLQVLRVKFSEALCTPLEAIVRGVPTLTHLFIDAAECCINDVPDADADCELWTALGQSSPLAEYTRATDCGGNFARHFSCLREHRHLKEVHIKIDSGLATFSSLLDRDWSMFGCDPFSVLRAVQEENAGYDPAAAQAAEARAEVFSFARSVLPDLISHQSACDEPQHDAYTGRSALQNTLLLNLLNEKLAENGLEACYTLTHLTNWMKNQSYSQKCKERQFLPPSWERGSEFPPGFRPGSDESSSSVEQKKIAIKKKPAVKKKATRRRTPNERYAGSKRDPSLHLLKLSSMAHGTDPSNVMVFRNAYSPPYNAAVDLGEEMCTARLLCLARLIYDMQAAAGPRIKLLFQASREGTQPARLCVYKRVHKELVQNCQGHTDAVRALDTALAGLYRCTDGEEEESTSMPSQEWRRSGEVVDLQEGELDVAEPFDVAWSRAFHTADRGGD
jgi:hypothetical protein